MQKDRDKTRSLSLVLTSLFIQLRVFLIFVLPHIHSCLVAFSSSLGSGVLTGVHTGVQSGLPGLS